MAITKGVGPTVAHVDAGGTTTSTVTLVGTTAGRGIVITVSWYNTTATLSNVTITGESNATLVTASAVFNSAIDNGRAQIAYLSNNTAGGDKTIVATFSGTVRFTIITATEIIGADLTDALDVGNAGTGNSTNATINLTTAASSAIFGVVLALTGVTKGANYTLIENSQTNWVENEQYWLNSGSAGSKAVNWTNTSNQWAISAASFKVAAAAPSNWGRMLGGELNRLVRPIYD